MREKVIETKLIQAVRRSGGLALKFVSPNLNGVPDRLLLFHGGQMAFAEVKAPGKKPRPPEGWNSVKKAEIFGENRFETFTKTRAGY